MKLEIILNLLFVFIFYSILGWLCEVVAIAITKKKFVNRGLSFGPLCTLYGFGAVITTVTFWHETNWLFIFCGSVLYGTMVQYLGGKFLEYIGKRKWWNYSNKRFNIDGYICLQYSLLWGALGVLATRIINRYVYLTLDKTPVWLIACIVLPILAFVLIDFLISFITLKKMGKRELWKTNIYSKALIDEIRARIKDAYPSTKKKEKVKGDLTILHIVALFIAAGFLGDLIEIVFCRFTMGKWMSRSAFAWGQFSMVWGFAFAIGTTISYRFRNAKWWKLIILGSVFGGSFEYLCSMITEYFFDQIYWDYSHLPFNVNGRICLLFCLFWGIALLINLKVLFPALMKVINQIPRKRLKIGCIVIIVFLFIDLIATNRIQQRYYARKDHIEPQNKIQELIDKFYPDEWVIERWNNLKDIKNGEKIRIYEG